MAKSVLVYCWRGCNPVKNLGEWYNKLIVNYLGYDIRYFACHRHKPDEPVLLIVGSNFHRVMMDRLLTTSREVRVWGQGNGWGQEYAVDPENPANPEHQDRIKVFALRGPNTAALANVSGVPLCDPGFLLPRILPKKARPRSARPTTYYVPHHTDRESADPTRRRLGIDQYVSVFMYANGVKPLIGHLVVADFILTGSLHTAILCIAYGVPFAKYVSPGHELPEPERWDDLFASLGCPAPSSVRSLKEGREWHAATKSQLTLPDTQALLDAFPHHLYK